MNFSNDIDLRLLRMIVTCDPCKNGNARVSHREWW